MARRKSPAASEPPAWVALPANLYAATAAELVTFSFKTTNSNIPAGGVRLSPTQALKLPYISARTLLAAERIPALDYIANAGKTATALKQLNELHEGKATAPSDEALLLRELLSKATQSGCEVGTDKVSMRARQLLLPRESGGYVAVTPLSAGGVSRLIRTAVRAHNEMQRNHSDRGEAGLQRVPTAVFGLGGSNPRNVGSLARDMQHPLVFFPPAENRQIKAALALHFQGVSIRLPRQLMQEFRTWSHENRRRNGGKISTDMQSREEEVDHIKKIALATLESAENARQHLLKHLDVLPNGGNPLVSSAADPVARGLTNPEQKDEDWSHAFASRLANLIADYRFRDERGEFNFDQNDRYTLQNVIEGLVQ